MKIKYITEALGDLLMVFFPVVIYAMLFFLRLVGGDIDYISADMAVVSMIMFSEPLPKLVKIRNSPLSQIAISVSLVAIVFCVILFLVDFFSSNGSPILVIEAGYQPFMYVDRSILFMIIFGSLFNFFTKIFYLKEMDSFGGKE